MPSSWRDRLICRATVQFRRKTTTRRRRRPSSPRSRPSHKASAPGRGRRTTRSRPRDVVSSRPARGPERPAPQEERRTSASTSRADAGRSPRSRPSCACTGPVGARRSQNQSRDVSAAPRHGTHTRPIKHDERRLRLPSLAETRCRYPPRAAALAPFPAGSSCPQQPRRCPRRPPRASARPACAARPAAGWARS